MKIMFVCHGNICRSTMAEFVMKYLAENAGRSKDFVIDSTATSLEEIGNDTHPGTKQKLREEGIPFTRRAARRITRADCINNDLIIAMAYENLSGLKRLFGNEFDSKIHLLLEYAPNYQGGHIPYGGGSVKEIADPWFSGNFDETFRDVWAGCSGLLQSF